MGTEPLLQSGTLWSRVIALAAEARAAGKLLPLTHTRETIVQSGIPFVVRVLTGLQRKDQAVVADLKASPFLPPEPELLVGALSNTHFCVLNKFSVVDHHLLLVTRDYVEQKALLDWDDFAALWRVLQEIDGIGFYNGGEPAGASQRHKHLQVVPLPLAVDVRLPIGATLNAVIRRRRLGSSSRLPFRHAVARLRLVPETLPAIAGGHLLARYRELLAAVGLPVAADAACQPAPYNLLVTRNWLLMVPRTVANYAGIPINALGFAGALLARDRAQFNRICELGPLELLRRVTPPPRAL